MASQVMISHRPDRSIFIIRRQCIWSWNRVLAKHTVSISRCSVKQDQV